MTEEDKLITMTGGLKKDAAKWLKREYPKKWRAWLAEGSFLQDLKEQFDYVAGTAQTVDLLKTMEQGKKETILKWSRRIEELCDKTDMSVEDMLVKTTFTEGLANRALRDKVRKHLKKSYRDLVKATVEKAKDARETPIYDGGSDGKKKKNKNKGKREKDITAAFDTIAAVQAEMAKGFEGMAKSIEALTAHTQQMQQAQQAPQPTATPTPQQWAPQPQQYIPVQIPYSAPTPGGGYRGGRGRGGGRGGRGGGNRKWGGCLHCGKFDHVAVACPMHAQWLAYLQSGQQGGAPAPAAPTGQVGNGTTPHGGAPPPAQ
jgi:hypothetical protein